MKLLRSVFLVIIPSGLIAYPLLGVAGLLGFVFMSRRIRTWPWTVPAIAVGGAVILSALSSAWKLDALGGSAAVIALGIALVSVFTRLSTIDTYYAMCGLSLGLITSGTLALSQTSGGGQAVAFAYHPNIAAGLFTIGVFAMLGAVSMPGPEKSRRLRAARLLWLCALLASLVGLTFTGSRSGILGLAAGAFVLVPFGCVWLWQRIGVWALGAPLVATVALATIMFPARSGQLGGGNLVVNSGFEEGLYPWRLGNGASRLNAVEASSGLPRDTLPDARPVDGAWFTLVANETAGWQVLLANTEPMPVEENTAYTVSLYTQPVPGAIAGTFLRVEARDERGSFIARAGLDDWTTGDEWSAGGRLILPTGGQSIDSTSALEPAVAPRAWTRFVATLPPTPRGTSELLMHIATDSPTVGAFGFIDAVQVEEGDTATEYSPGPSAGLRAYLGPLVPRLLALRDPLSASGGRISMWYFSLELAAARPFLGYGFGVVKNLVQPEAPRYVADPLPHPHSFYLQLLLEGGSLTLVAVLMWFGLVFWWLLRRALSGSWLAATTLAALVALLVQSVFDPILAEGEVLGLWWVSVASAAATGLTNTRTLQPTDRQ